METGVFLYGKMPGHGYNPNEDNLEEDGEQKPMRQEVKEALQFLNFEFSRSWEKMSKEDMWSLVKSLDSLAESDHFERYISYFYTDDRESVQSAMERWEVENEMVTSIVDSIRLQMCRVICDETVKRMEEVIFEYSNGHGRIIGQLKEKLFRVDAANKQRRFRRLIDPEGTRFLATGFLTLEEDEDPPFVTVEKRREHYFCGPYYVKAKDIPSWNGSRHQQDPLAMDSLESVTLGDTIAFWEGDGLWLEVDVLACMTECLLTEAPLKMDLWTETCQSTGAQVPGGGVLNGYRMPKESPARHAITTSEVEDPSACLTMMLESVVGNNFRTVAIPSMCIAYCTREKPANKRKNRGCVPLMCEVRAALRLIEDFVRTHPGELDRVVIYGKESCLSGYFNALNLMIPHWFDGKESVNSSEYFSLTDISRNPRSEKDTPSEGKQSKDDYERDEVLDV